MPHENSNILADCIRHAVANWFARLGSPPDASVAETLLIRNGFFCGRRYRTDNLEAVWFFEEDQLKIYGPDGSVAHVFHASSLSDGTSSEAA